MRVRRPEIAAELGLRTGAEMHAASRWRRVSGPGRLGP